MATVTQVVTQLVTKTAAAAAATSTAANKVTPQGGILESPPLNPTHYNPKDPIITFIIQVRHSPHPTCQWAPQFPEMLTLLL